MINGNLSLGDFTAFYIYLVHALRPGALARHVAEHGPARGRLGQPHVRDPRPRARDGQPARMRRRCPPGGGRVSMQRVTLRYDGGEPSLTGIDLEVAAGPHGGPGRADRLGQDQPGRAAGAALRPQRGPGRDRRRRHPRGRPRLAAARDRLRRRRQLPLLGHRRRATSPTRGPTRPGSRSRRPPAARRRTASSPSCPTATRRSSASAA